MYDGLQAENDTIRHELDDVSFSSANLTVQDKGS